MVEKVSFEATVSSARCNVEIKADRAQFYCSRNNSVNKGLFTEV